MNDQIARYQHGSPEPEPVTQAAPQRERVGGSAFSMGRDGEVTEQAPVSVNVADFTNGETGILGTARTTGGVAKAVADLEPTDTVEIDGMRTSVANAEQLGYLRRDKNGMYHEVDQSKAAEEKTTEATGGGPKGFVTEADEAAFGELCNGVDGSTHMVALNELLTSGEVGRSTLEFAASQMSVAPEEMSQRVERVANAFRGQASAAVKAAGAPDFEDFAAWANENKPSAIKQAMSLHFTERNPSVYRELVRDYFADLPRWNKNAILTANHQGGYSVREDGNGVVLVNVPGVGELEWRTAVRGGFITVAGKRI